MQLNGTQSRKFSEALRDAFTPKELARMLFYKLDKRLSDYAGDDDAPTVVFELIAAANRQEWVDKLIMAAREANPANSLLYEFAQQFQLGSTSVPRQELERIIQETNPFLDPDRFRALMGALEPRVCRVEITRDGGRIFGTGFLVSPAVIMTNYHVVAPVLPAGYDPAGAKPSKVDALARFDYKRMYDAGGKQVGVNEGRTCPFDDDWLVDGSPTNPDGQLPRPEELDYALVRLKEPVGDDVLDGGAKLDVPVERGFIEIPQTPSSLQKDGTLFILQHPRGDTLKLALETKSVLGVFENGIRIRYTTNTEPGSSGSPCFTPDWELAALHHSGDPDFAPQHKPTYNEGIPIGAIRDLITAHGAASNLG